MNLTRKEKKAEIKEYTKYKVAKELLRQAKSLKKEMKNADSKKGLKSVKKDIIGLKAYIKYIEKSWDNNYTNEEFNSVYKLIFIEDN